MKVIFFVFFYIPKYWLYQHFIYIATRHSNNFSHKLCSSDSLVRSHVIAHVTLGYTFENSLVPTLCQKMSHFYNPKYWLYQHFIYIATRHSTNFFHKLCSSNSLVRSHLIVHVTLGYTSENSLVHTLCQKIRSFL